MSFAGAALLLALRRVSSRGHRRWTASSTSKRHGVVFCRQGGSWSRGTMVSLEPPLIEPEVMLQDSGQSVGVDDTEKLPDIVQFDSAIYYVEESEGMMHIDLVRFGRFSKTISVDWCTEDASAVAGDRYTAAKGTAVFQPGEVNKTIAVEIRPGQRDWNTTLEFKIRLTNPQDCEVGRFLYLCRVKVIDDDAFPTNRYQKEIEEFGPSNLDKAGVSGTDLFLEYVKLNFTYDGIAWKTAAFLFVDQLSNLYFLVTTYLIKYVADGVLAANTDLGALLIPGSRDQTLMLVGFMYIAPCALLNVLDLWKAQLGISEASRAALQKDVFRKYMNFDERSRNKVQPSEVCLLMVQDCADIVESGYMNIFEVAKNIGKLGVGSFFILQESSDATVPLILFSLATAGYLAFNLEESVAIREALSDKQASIMGVVQEGSQKYRLVADYYLRPQLQDHLETQIEQFNERSVPVATKQVTSTYFPIWMSTLLVTGWVAFGGHNVLTGSMEIGTYLATVNVFKEVGDSFKDIFTAALEFSKAIGPLQQVTTLLNSPTMLRQMKHINRERRKWTKLIRTPENLARLRRESGFTYGTDAIPLQVCDLSFAYETKTEPEFSDVNLSVRQGSLVGVVGRRLGGKATFMKLLGMVLYPTQGTINVPAHLRILHVSAQPQLLAGSLWKNLCIGRMYWRDDDFEADRVISICKRIGMGRGILDRLAREREAFLSGKEDPNCTFTSRISDTDVMLIHLARAFIYSPEVLVMNRPTQTFSEGIADLVIQMLREFCDNRGVELPPQEAEKRRPRTAFVSFARMSGVRQANVIWSVEKGTVKEICLDEVQDEGLSA